MNGGEVIAQHYGLEHQLVKLSEECGELIAAVARVLNVESNAHKNLIEELADVAVVWRQVVDLLGAREQVNDFMEYKVNRQVERIRNKNGGVDGV